MKMGDSVYLCENLFIHFRELFDWVKSDQNRWKSDFKCQEIGNRFFYIFEHGSEAIIAIQDSFFDQDLYSHIPSIKMEKFKIPNKFTYRNESAIRFYDFVELFDIDLNLKSSNFICDIKRNVLFKVPLDKLTKIEE